ncbi:BIN3-like protein [Mya arenaria]|uniref:BIN3-like protein n=1 Tax=Mya arenaria TaxID=6604 RepID=A0ABY7FH39_MYAAR|nr:bridging integrator 3-like [Mya arenaria]WAR21493.1 BIN3-like protein [Mya arenaria]
MSWNPFSRHAGSKKIVVSRHSEREIEREVKRLDELEEASRKLYKDGRRLCEANNAVGKAEHKLVQGVLSSGLCVEVEGLQHDLETWEGALEDIQRNRQEMNANIQKTMVEPMKKFNAVFPGIQTAIKKREQSLQDYNKKQANFNKYQERERTGANVVKLDTNRKVLDAAQRDFENHDSALRQDLPKFYDGRIDYFKPSFDALVRSQLAYNNEAFRAYTEVSSEMFSNSKCSENERRQRINQTLSEIKALAITVDD